MTPFSASRSWLRAAMPLAYACVLLAFSASVAQAEDEEPAWYFEFSTGVTYVPNQTLRDGAVSQSRVESDLGYHVGGALGTRILDMIRAEIELTYREASTDQAALVGPAITTDGKTSLLSLIANGYLDFDLGLYVIPYVGAGLGWGSYTLDIARKTAGDLDIDDSDSVFVYNAMVGVTIPITPVAELNIGYRYVGVEGADNLGGVIGGVNQDVESEFDAHEANLGLRFNF